MATPIIAAAPAEEAVMAGGDSKRRMAAILSADVAGYSRLMQDDEAATVETLVAYRQVFAEHVTDHDGRIVDSPGDNILAELASPVEAVAAAVAIQKALAERNASLAPTRRMAFRIGINLGDVITRPDGTVYGDGVNVAARLEGLAEPGGIVVSAAVHEHVEGKLAVAFADLGPQSLKNIDKPVRAWRVGEGGRARPARRLAWIGAAAATAILAAAGLWLALSPPEPAEQMAATADDPILALPGGPAIAVLPFANLGGEAEQDWFADGIAEDIITRLSRFTELKVIARNSSFQYKGQAVDVRDVGRDLGADYVLEGSVRRTPETIRVTVQLLDARDGAHLWAETYDRDLTTEDIFALQDEITTRVAAAIGGNFGAVAVARIRELQVRAPQDLESYECILLGFHYQRVVDAAAHLAARTCLEKAIAREPDYVDALAWLGQMYVEEVWSGFNPRADGPPSLEAAFAVVGHAIDLDPGHQKSRHVMAFAHFLNKDYGQFRVEAKKAISLNPNNVETLAEMAWMTGYSGDWKLGMALFDKIQRMGPDVPPWLYILPYNFHYRNGDYALALEDARQFREMGHWAYMHLLAYAYAQLGNAEEARAAMAEARRMEPSISEALVRETWQSLFAEGSHIEHVLEGYRKAVAFETEAEAEASR